MPDLSPEARARVEAAVEAFDNAVIHGVHAAIKTGCSKYATWDEAHAARNAARAALLATVEAVVGEAVAAASEDTARLDWLEKRLGRPYTFRRARPDGTWIAYGWRQVTLFSSYRGAVDAARAADAASAARPSAPEVGP